MYKAVPSSTPLRRPPPTTPRLDTPHHCPPPLAPKALSLSFPPTPLSPTLFHLPHPLSRHHQTPTPPPVTVTVTHIRVSPRLLILLRPRQLSTPRPPTLSPPVSSPALLRPSSTRRSRRLLPNARLDPAIAAPRLSIEPREK
ncbi:hypothetical protein PCL_07961 [Purpureocillium lilacinum]|uniref:Uncharacterized protein n=1 Tax=Purpureocillium lilacinum TaxID=33203 RepID=A0A2U3EJG8_PURLI|nr:hypothetical protein PCL_07961 [Purpureocillium lilacinum]